jgi:hypothetical protein
MNTYGKDSTGANGGNGLPRLRSSSFQPGLWSSDILHANGVWAYQPRATPWENRRVIRTRPARAGAAPSVPKVKLIECHLVAVQQRSEFCLKSDLRPCRAQESSKAGFPRVLPWADMLRAFSACSSVNSVGSRNVQTPERRFPTRAMPSG